MAQTSNTDYQFNIEDERWQDWYDWLAHNGRSIMDHALAKGLDEEGANSGNAYPEINLLLLNDVLIQEINRDYRGRDAPTNVLSFPQFENAGDIKTAISHADDDGNAQKKPFLLGDVVLSYETIERQAHEASNTMRNHLAHMLVHAILHLLGYDHELDHQAQEMEALECDILEAYGIKSPYTVSGSVAYSKI